MLIGHSRTDASGNRTFQSLKEHSTRVAELCSRICNYINAPCIGYLTGLLHDMGKANASVQAMLRGEKQKGGNHSSAGARYIWEMYRNNSDPAVRLAAKLIALSIVCHHSGRCDIYSPEGNEEWLDRIMTAQIEPYYDQIKQAFFDECATEKEIEDLMERAAKEFVSLFLTIREIGKRKNNEGKLVSTTTPISFMVGLLHRVIFGALVDADWTDTSCFMEGKPLPQEMTDERRQEMWNEISGRTEKFLTSLTPDKPIDYLREEISKECFLASADNPGIYRLFVPTGGGKTYSGLRFSIETAKKQNASKVVYFAPYKSILTQNAESFRKVVGEDAYVLEHHSDVVIEKEGEEENWAGARERWQGVPIITTTMVQFLNTLFAAPRQNVRRLPGLARSILFFDEIQCLPLEDTYIFNLSINFLAKVLDCTIVLCTATQPALDQVEYPLLFNEKKDIVENYEEKFEQFKRTRIVWQKRRGGYSKEELASFIGEKLEGNQSVLVVLNTKSAAEKIYDALKAQKREQDEIYCLTTNLCVAHRRDIIEKIHRYEIKKEKTNKKLICVSTQLIEAGVDLSFDCVIRSMAGLTSVAQAAGRCNRHGESECKDVYLIECDTTLEDLRYLPSIEKAKQATLLVLENNPEIEDDLLSPHAMEKYYQKYYDNKKEMRYRLVKNKRGSYTLFDLLSTNAAGKNAFTELRDKEIPKTDWCFNQAFGTAESAFEAIPDETVPVLVPYGESGKRIIADILAERGKQVPYDLIRKSQSYTVALGHGQCKSLEKQEGIRPYFDGRLLVLQDGFYDENKGVQVRGKEGDIIFV